MLNSFPRPGTLVWIGLRPARRVPMLSVDEVWADVSDGLVGDRFSGRANRKRQVTLIQEEHLAVCASFIGSPVRPEQLRRNLVVHGINLAALKGGKLRIGDAVLQLTGPCHPCSRMEETFGPGGLNALRGHGGQTAEVLVSGQLRIGDAVIPLDTAESTAGKQSDLFAEPF